MFQRQLLHVLALAGLLAGMYFLWTSDMGLGDLFGVPSEVWLAAALGVPIVHQTYVWLVWRLELHHTLISRTFGRDRGFRLFATFFSILFASRLGTIILLAVSNGGTLDFSPAVGVALAGVLLLPTLYLYYSVLRYFGPSRAYGIDHFDPAYRTMPFVRKGIFRFTSNGIYTFGFFVLWMPALVHRSEAALLAALFSQVYIWVHYYCTELPDIERIYGGKSAAGAAANA